MTTPQPPRWYSVNNIGMATLCADKADAEDVASTCDIDFPRQAPHRAVQLVEVSELDKLHAEISRLTAANDALKEEVAGYDIMGLAEEQRQLRGPFHGIGTPNAMFGQD